MTHPYQNKADKVERVKKLEYSLHYHAVQTHKHTSVNQRNNVRDNPFESVDKNEQQRVDAKFEKTQQKGDKEVSKKNSCNAMDTTQLISDQRINWKL